MSLGIYLILLKLLLSYFLSLPECSYKDKDEAPLLQQANQIYLALAIENLSSETFLMAYEGYSKLLSQQYLIRDTILTIIDYSKPSDQERLFVIDMKNRKLLCKSLVAHGKGSGEKVAQSFSNQPSSHKSCLGFFITGNSYNGKHGYSLRIVGVENGINCNALSRTIVFHGASYVNKKYIEKNGRLGRSFGCPALPFESNQSIIDSIKNSSCIFIFGRDESYFKNTNLINPSSYSQIVVE